MSLNARFAVAYGLLAFCVPVSAVAFMKVLSIPKQDVKRLDLAVLKRDVQGVQNLGDICKGNVTQSLATAGTTGTVKVVSVKVTGNKAVAKVHVTSPIFTGAATCDFQKSNWTVTQVK